MNTRCCSLTLLAINFGCAHGQCLTTHLRNYTSTAGDILEGYLAYDPSQCSTSQRCPAVVVIQDWDGMNAYEMERARMLAEMGYVALAADIYGVGTPVENMQDWMAASSAHRGNPDLYMDKMEVAIAEVRSLDFVDETKVAVIGYCFGGTGIVNMALSGGDVLGVVGYHSGIAPNARVAHTNGTAITAKLLLHSGVMDDAAQDIALLESELEAAEASYEIVRFGSGVVHSFTHWGSNTPGMAVYDARADYRSRESTKLFLHELFHGMPVPERSDESSSSLTTTLHNYTSTAGDILEGYLAYDPSRCSTSQRCPAVVVIQDGDGMNDYEMERT